MFRFAPFFLRLVDTNRIGAGYLLAELRFAANALIALIAPPAIRELLSSSDGPFYVSPVVGNPVVGNLALCRIPVGKTTTYYHMPSTIER